MNKTLSIVTLFVVAALSISPIWELPDVTPLPEPVSPEKAACLVFRAFQPHASLDCNAINGNRFGSNGRWGA